MAEYHLRRLDQFVRGPLNGLLDNDEEILKFDLCYKDLHQLSSCFLPSNQKGISLSAHWYCNHEKTKSQIYIYHAWYIVRHERHIISNTVEPSTKRSFFVIILRKKPIAHREGELWNIFRGVIILYHVLAVGTLYVINRYTMCVQFLFCG